MSIKSYCLLLLLLVSVANAKYLLINYYANSTCSGGPISREWFVVDVCKGGMIFKSGAQTSSPATAGGATAGLLSGAPITSLDPTLRLTPSGIPLTSLIPTLQSTAPSTSQTSQTSQTSSSAPSITSAGQPSSSSAPSISSAGQPSSSSTPTVSSSAGQPSSSNGPSNIVAQSGGRAPLSVEAVSTTSAPVTSLPSTLGATASANANAVTQMFCLDPLACTQSCYVMEVIPISPQCVTTSSGEHAVYTIVDAFLPTDDDSVAICWSIDSTPKCNTPPFHATESLSNVASSSGYKVNCTKKAYNYYTCSDPDCQIAKLALTAPIDKCIANATDYVTYKSSIPRSIDTPTPSPTTPSSSTTRSSGNVIDDGTTTSQILTGSSSELPATTTTKSSGSILATSILVTYIIVLVASL
eukprot:gene14362-16948_t